MLNAESKALRGDEKSEGKGGLGTLFPPYKFASRLGKPAPLLDFNTWQGRKQCEAIGISEADPASLCFFCQFTSVSSLRGGGGQRLSYEV